jgi:metal-responsive CopG/Arc/MetJ family transcriptional regulator
MLDEMILLEGSPSRSAMVERAIRRLYASHSLVAKKRTRRRV